MIAELVIRELMNALITGMFKCGSDKTKFTPLFEEKGMKYICQLIRGLASHLSDDVAIDVRDSMWNTFTSNSLSRGEGKLKIYFKPFDPSYSCSSNQQKALPFLTTFIACVTPTRNLENWNEYIDFILKIINNRATSNLQLKSAAKMLAAIINKNIEIDENIWKVVKNQSGLADERSLTLTVWVAKVCTGI